MEGYRPVDSFDESNAVHYDDLAVRGDEAAAVSFLHQLAGGGPALELGIGTGRIALPLAARGADVDGIDLSEPMVARLRAKPDGNQLDVTMGNFADVGVPGRYRLVYVVFNSFFNLLARTNRCGASKCRHPPDRRRRVRDRGLRAGLPRPPRPRPVRTGRGDRGRPGAPGPAPPRRGHSDGRGEPRVHSADGMRFNPVVQRYAWPAELDLMARIAGLRLRERWGGWSGEPFGSASDLHISVDAR